MPTYIYSYNNTSMGARALARALNIRRISHGRSRFQGDPRKTVINWGSSNFPEHVRGSTVINDPSVVARMCDKLSFFQDMQGNAPIPEFTQDRQQALNWLADGASVCIRTMTRASGGRGLVYVTPNNLGDFVNAPLYTKYMKKRDEYRVHVFNNEVIDTQRKALRNDFERDEANWQIRNMSNGFIFARNENREVPEQVHSAAIQAMRASGLTFGAVDIVFNSNQNRAYVLEINTAPGLMNTTLENYAEAFRGIL